MGAPNLQDLAKYSVNRAGQVEVIRQGLFDTQVYAAAGTTALTYFATPIGQGSSAAPGAAGTTKTIADTNMQLAGNLPAGQNYLIESIEVDVVPGSSAATTSTFALVNPIVFAAAASAGTVFGAASDVAAIYNTGTLTLNVGSKIYLQEGPLKKFPPKTCLDISAAVATTSATVGQTAIQMARAIGRPMNIDPVRLESSQNFNVVLNWPVAVATPSGFNAAVRITLDGYLYRNSQ